MKKEALIKKIKWFFSNRKRAAIAFLVIILLGFLSWRTLGGKKEVPQFETTAVEKGTIIASVSASGQILTANITSVTTQASGLVSKVYVQDGDWVNQGQQIALITLDNEGAQSQAQAWASYLSAKNSLASAQTSLYSLQSELFAVNQKFINDAVARELPEDDPTYIQQHADWLAAEAKYNNQQNVIQQTQVALNNAWLSYLATRSVVTAPTSGTVTGVAIAEGMPLGNELSDDSGQSQTVAAIASEGTPLASFNLSEIDVSQVVPNQKATITLDSLPGKTFTGKVVSVNKIGSVTSGVTQYPVIIKFDTKAPEILPNMATTAKIIIEKKENVLLVPSGAVQTQNNQRFVQVLSEGQTQLVSVETGLVSDTQTEIVSGVREGDLVITSTTSLQETRGSSPFGTSGMQMFRMPR